MTVVLVLLSIVLLIGVAIAWELLRLRGAAPAELDPDEISESKWTTEHGRRVDKDLVVDHGDAKRLIGSVRRNLTALHQ